MSPCNMVPTILFLADTGFLNPVSGAEQVLCQQIDGMIRRCGRIYVLTRQNDASGAVTLKTDNGVRQAAFILPEGLMLRQAVDAIRRPLQLFGAMAAGGRLDVVVAHQPMTLAVLSVARQIEGVPLVYVYHSPWHLEYAIQNDTQSSLLTFGPALVRRLLEGYCLKRAKRIVVLSRYMQQKLLSLHRVDERRLTVIPGGFDPDRFNVTESRQQLKQALGLPPDCIHLLTVRNLEPRMGLDRLIAAIGLLRERSDRPVYLVVGGSGPEKDRLQALVDDSGLARQICLKGFIPTADLPRYYAAADFFILPTRRLEGFGLVTVEALACGTPVLGTPVGATVELLSGLDRSLLFNDNSARSMAAGIHDWLERFSADPDAYKRLRAQCRAFALEAYTWQNHNQRLERLINECLPARGQHGLTSARSPRSRAR